MVKGTERGDKNCEKRVLIAAQQSEFKEAVVSKVVEGLEQDACYVKVIDVKKLREESTGDYEAMVIVNTCKMWRLNRHVRKFLKKVQETGKIVLLTTAGDPEWKAKGVQVDAITSASEMEEVGAVAETVLEKVRTLLGKEMGS